jgi:hypothetical protein
MRIGGSTQWKLGMVRYVCVTFFRGNLPVLCQSALSKISITLVKNTITIYKNLPLFGTEYNNTMQLSNNNHFVEDNVDKSVFRDITALLAIAPLVDCFRKHSAIK